MDMVFEKLRANLLKISEEPDFILKRRIPKQNIVLGGPLKLLGLNHDV